mmetsp:Transcript_17268/g.40695  ORF Transcript_17268/g.40695 Transcript_17268/m.40695 type:complete len:348 (+) Transcript_17268:39-1082(+)
MIRQEIVFVLLASLLLQVVSGWVFSSSTLKSTFSSKSKQSRRQGLFSALAEDLDTQDIEPQGDDFCNDDSKMQQFWLDLRGTAIRPNEALAFLQEFVYETENESSEDSAKLLPNLPSTFDIRDLVDRIIVSEDIFASMVESGIPTGPLLYVTKDGLLAENSQALNQSLIKGTVLKASSGFIDPVTAIEVAGSDSAWVVIDQEQDEDEVKDIDVWTQQLEGLVQILSASRTGSPLSLSDFSLIGDQPGAEQQSDLKRAPNSAGGLAMLCRTLPMLLSIDQCLASLSLASSGTTETESGILLSTASTNDDMKDSSSSNRSIPRALVLPFDLRLWRTASELKQLNSNQLI